MICERIYAALDSHKPAIDVPQENGGCVGHGNAEIAGAPRTLRERRRAGECLLSICGHDGRSRAAAEGGVAVAASMLVDEPRSMLGVAARPPRTGLDENFDPSGGKHAEKTEAEQPAEFADAGIALATAAARGGAHGEPYFVTGRRAIDALQHELEVEAFLQLTDDDQRRLAALERNQIALLDLSLDLIAEALEKAFHGQIKRRFQIDRSPGVAIEHAGISTTPATLARYCITRGQLYPNSRLPISAASEGAMKFVCDAPDGKTWFRIETEAEALRESEAMRHAVEKYFRRERDSAVQNYQPTSSVFIEQGIGLNAHIQREMSRFLTLRDGEGNALVTAMLPAETERAVGFRIIIVGPDNSDPYSLHAEAIEALGRHLGLSLERARCYPYHPG